MESDLDVLFDGDDVLVRRNGRWVPPTDEEERWEAARALLRRHVGRSQLPTPEPFHRRVEEYLAPVAGKFNFGRMHETYASADRFRRWVSVVADRRPVSGLEVLASGCGVGGSLVAWWEAGVARAVGVEVDPALVEMAQLRIAGVPGLMAELYDGWRLPFDDASFDLVESLDVIEHVPVPDTYMREHVRVLRPGGAILLVTPNRLWPVEQHVNVVGPPWLPLAVADRLYPWLARRARAAGMEDLAWRMDHVPEVREQNLSFRRLRALAKQQGLFLEALDPRAHEQWPLPPVPGPVAGLARTRLGKFIAPTRALAVLLWKGEPA